MWGNSSVINWLEIRSSSVSELETLGRDSQIHPLVIEDCIHRNQRAKLEDFDTHQFLVWFMVAKGRVYELQFIVLPSTLVFVPHEPPPEETIWKDFFKINDSAKDVWHMLYQALDRVSDVTGNEVKAIGVEINAFESKVFGEKFDPSSVLVLKRRLSEMEHAIEHLRSVPKQLQNFYQNKDDLTWKWRDLSDHCERAFRNVMYFRSQIGSTLDLYWGY
ncbi:MAG: hypothetical protein EB078_08920 [Proteobacteria bacterium]|nr:hypothetical protein [Pseudomonadota bacterium]NDC24507.1 hypothetical protein [Pseudomonadota bacterium]NDD05015.1 hypothetical protein [Pseudomonadota bacterium]NDG27489.1 hypothetical protein [Pseudomonadota bacterium]